MVEQGDRNETEAKMQMRDADDEFSFSAEEFQNTLTTIGGDVVRIGTVVEQFAKKQAGHVRSERNVLALNAEAGSAAA